MSEAWQASRVSIRRLKAALQKADEDTRYAIAFWTIGLLMMAIAITAQFGGLGFLFCAGLVIWAAGMQGLK